MAVKSDRLEARLSPAERERLEQAAALEGVSVSAFVIGAAVERADELVATHTTTTVPGDYFDKLVEALDRPDRAPALTRAARRAERSARIARP